MFCKEDGSLNSPDNPHLFQSLEAKQYINGKLPRKARVAMQRKIMANHCTYHLLYRVPYEVELYRFDISQLYFNGT